MTGANRLVVLPARTHIVEVKPNKLRRIFRQVDAMIEQSHRLLDVGVTRVVPVSRRASFRQTRDKIRVIGIKRQLLKFLPIFEAQFHALDRRIVENFEHACPRLRPKRLHPLPQFFQRLAHERRILRVPVATGVGLPAEIFFSFLAGLDQKNETLPR